MKSTELHRLLKLQLGDWFRSNGFKRAARTQSGWYRGVSLVWFQCDKWGWDQYEGSGVFVNFETQPAAGSPTWSGEVRRLRDFLTAEELEVARGIQNGVISRLKLPPTEYLDMMRSQMSPFIQEGLLLSFTPVEQAYWSRQDFTLRYFSPDDVSQWCAFLLGVLPRISEELKK